MNFFNVVSGDLRPRTDISKLHNFNDQFHVFSFPFIPTSCPSRFPRSFFFIFHSYTLSFPVIHFMFRFVFEKNNKKHKHLILCKNYIESRAGFHGRGPPCLQGGQGSKDLAKELPNKVNLPNNPTITLTNYPNP